ncbi:MAG: alpha-glucan family phosphorylase [Nitrospiraceae bacterium]|nr:alpha-glucan family phosphorylase [Nitrospiraceae bacterium]
MDGFEQKTLAEVPEGLPALNQLAFNLWWSWHPEARMLFKTLNRAAWKLSGHNPVKMLNGLDKSVFENALKDPVFMDRYEKIISRFNSEIKNRGAWFPDNIKAEQMHPVAFFSAEYGLHHSLPFYAGGLGFLAGDFLKESNDLGLPMVGVGFMYPEGYLHQRIAVNGWQQDTDEPIDRANAPISRVVDNSGDRLIVQVPFIAPPIYVEVWRIEIGNVHLYLIDTDIDSNDPWNRSISARLYTGNIEQRLRQEIVLGIGGKEVLKTLGISHSVLHLNEGHPAFAILERIRERVEPGMGFDEAFNEVRETTVFTTHTPVPAGTDVFPFPLMEKYFNTYWPSLGIDRERFFSLGINPASPNSGFNMTAFALRCSAFHNGVSRKHGEVARKMWNTLWPQLPEDKVPIDSVTNGVHVSTWIEPKMELLFNRYLDGWLAEQDDPQIWQKVNGIPDVELWNTHYWLKMKLIMRTMERARDRWLTDTPEPQVILASGVILDPNALTIGFARRFVTYKRANLIFQDPDRLKGILNNKWRPVQIIFAGKAHPDDAPAKKILQQVFDAAKDPSYGGRIAVVEDYDEMLAQYLTHGVDVWLNNPLPPLEASGTSGMKASLNGVPNLSILDGWWIEGYNGTNGWAFEGAQGPDRDARDAGAIYKLLEEQIVPLFYKVGDDGVPHEWVRVMKNAIISNAPRFSARRMVKEYCTKFYSRAVAGKEAAGKPA